jgi:hypothetical protein
MAKMLDTFNIVQFPGFRKEFAENFYFLEIMTKYYVN